MQSLSESPRVQGEKAIFSQISAKRYSIISMHQFITRYDSDVHEMSTSCSPKRQTHSFPEYVRNCN